MIQSDSPINIVLAADANYSAPLAVTLCSIVLNCDRARPLRVYVIQSGIESEQREKIKRSLARTNFPNVQLQWLAAPMTRLADYKLAHKYTTHLTFARLMLTELLPADVAKVIYLDCDLVVDDDIAKLWDLDLEGKALGAVRDTAGFVSEPDGLLNYRELGIPGDAHYFNAGVLLIDLEKWRREKLGEHVLNYLSTHRDIIQMADQEALNAVLWNDWKELEYRWNWQILHRDYRLGRLPVRWTPPTNERSIIHFTTGEKPWLPGCDYMERTYYWRYLDQTDWSGGRVAWRDELKHRAMRGIKDLRNLVNRRRAVGR